jgi:hypothetical protein
MKFATADEVIKWMPECPLLGLSGHLRQADECPLSGVKQTSRSLVAMAANEGDIREKYGLPA